MQVRSSSASPPIVTNGGLPSDSAAGDLCVEETQHVDSACAALRNLQPLRGSPVW